MQHAETRTNVDANKSLKDNRVHGGLLKYAGLCLSHTKQQKQLSKVIIN